MTEAAERATPGGRGGGDRASGVGEGCGLYLHLPFCLAKCGYCDFNSYPSTDPDLASRYVAALEREVASYAGQWSGREQWFATVFFGGGTPTLLPAAVLVRLLQHCQQLLPILPGAEVTVEANPETLSLERLATLRRGGFNRLSMGAQTFDDRLLKTLGRTHSAARIREGVVAARLVGFDNVSLDLIFALPGQSVAGWRHTLEQALELAPDHLSTYNLTIEEGTPFAQAQARGELALPCEEIQAEMYRLAIHTLTAAGYEHYEVSNFARPGRQSRHNQLYWRNAEYLGLGAGAYSYLGGERCGNEKLPQRYIEAVERHGCARLPGERLEKGRLMGETVMLGLRLRRGVSLEEFEGRFGVPLAEVYGGVLEHLQAVGLVHIEEDHLRLTPEGLLLADEVTLELLSVS